MVDEINKDEGEGAEKSGGIAGILGRLFKKSPQKNLRKFERYQVEAPLSVTVGDKEFACSVANVSAGGVKIAPAVEAEIGAMLTVTHPKTGLKLDGQIVGQDPEGTRIRFDSEEAGTIVSVWVRTLHSDD